MKSLAVYYKKRMLEKEVQDLSEQGANQTPKSTDNTADKEEKTELGSNELYVYRINKTLK